jgi:hypothetical protein
LCVDVQSHVRAEVGAGVIPHSLIVLWGVLLLLVHRDDLLAQGSGDTMIHPQQLVDCSVGAALAQGFGSWWNWCGRRHKVGERPLVLDADGDMQRGEERPPLMPIGGG